VIHQLRVLLRVALVLACLGPLFGCRDAGDDTAQSTETERPNIVLIVTDDQRWDSLDEMPTIYKRADWARFTNAFVNDPMCCPSRATILTGQYTQNTGVTTLREGANLDEDQTIATMLHDAGYRTGFAGKYVNGYTFGRGLYVPPGWDRFAAYKGPNEYLDYSLVEDGELVNYGTRPQDYSTDVFEEQARDFINSTDTAQPLFFYAAFNAPHYSARTGLPEPADRHQGACTDQSFELPANFNAFDTVAEPVWLQAAAPVRPESMVTQRAATCDTLQALDEGVASIIDALREADRLDNTYIVFTSDNGYSFGEHRLVGKGHLYEESIRVPLLVAGPDVVPKPVDRLTSNIDFVPTMLDWAGASAPEGFVDGTSFAGVLRGETDPNEPAAVLLRGCRTGFDRQAPDRQAQERAAVCGGYYDNMGLNWGLRTAAYKYVEYPSGEVQLFDLRDDPWETTNLASDPAQEQLIARLHAQLARMRRE
jgi:N-acetylglucosamine-6-sulfatase